MKRAWMRCLCAVLLLCLLLSALGCRSDQTNPPADGESSAEGEAGGQSPDNGGSDADTGDDQGLKQPSDPTKMVFTGKYKLIRPDERTDDEVNAVVLLGRGLQSAYGERYSLETDYVSRNQENIVPNEYEVLIGATNRKESQEVLATLGYNDWCYKLVSRNVVVICGGSPAATLAATKAFLAEVIGYTEDDAQKVITPGSPAELSVGTEYTYKYVYPVSSFVLGAHDITDYTIVTSTKNKSTAAATAIADHFRSLMGVDIPVATLAQYKGGPAILLGCADTDDTHLDYTPYGKDRYFILRDGDNIILDCITKDAAVGVANRFIQECTPKEGVSAVTVALDNDTPITGLYIPKGTNSLVLDSVESTEVAAGVVYEERLYFDPNGKPVRAYVMTIAPGAATIAASLPNDENKIGTYANIKNQVIAARENGKNVIAGINADFFEDTMLGLCIRDGSVLHDTGGRQWFGITMDGEAVMGEYDEYRKYEGKLITAVGGSNIVINNDYVTNISVDHEFGYIRHPRTAVGIKPDGSVVFLVVDGRQSAVSNGASLADLADILGSMGCHEAINLDGGGSSTFVLVNENGEAEVKNSPSDGSPRSVADGLVVILP